MKVLHKRYLKMNLELTSSLSIGSGENENTDHDILVNSNGVPYIPGSAVAGVTRHALNEVGVLTADEDQYIFGNVVISHASNGNNGMGVASIRGENTENQAESRIVTYDVLLKAENDQYYVTNRDMVRLDQFKTAIEGAKFDMEILEPGTTGTVIIEENQTEVTEKDPLLLIAQIWNSGRIRFGAKTTKGYGCVRVVSLYKAEFDMTMPAEVMDWLSFSPFDENSAQWKKWENTGKLQTDEIQLSLGLRQSGGISIRKYTTDVFREGNAPDYAQMTFHNGNPVIPGTSWAGAFRHAIEKFIGEELTKAYFGDVNAKSRSKAEICFSESRITEGDSKLFTRCAINRFTGGAAAGALYTEKAWYGGKTILTITLRRNAITGAERFKNALAAAVVDLNEGILAVGGETSVGRGLFTVTSVNGQAASKNAVELYEQVREVLRVGAEK